MRAGRSSRRRAVGALFRDEASAGHTPAATQMWKGRLKAELWQNREFAPE
jgi:hypothetical protein